MAKPCERCSTLIAMTASGRVEVSAIQQDSAERVKSAEPLSLHRIALFQDAKKRWYAAALEYKAHHGSHFSPVVPLRTPSRCPPVLR
jgi:hypothetical protein